MAKKKQPEQIPTTREVAEEEEAGKEPAGEWWLSATEGEWGDSRESSVPLSITANSQCLS